VPLDRAAHRSAQPYHVVARPAESAPGFDRIAPWPGTAIRGARAASVSSAAASPLALPSTHHGHAVLDEQIAGEQHALVGQPYDQVARRVRPSRAAPRVRRSRSSSRRAAAYRLSPRSIGHVGVGETRHLLLPDHQRPGRFGRLAALLVPRRSRRRDARSPERRPAQGHCTEVMIGWWCVRTSQRMARGDRMDRAHQPLPCAGWRAHQMHDQCALVIVGAKPNYVVDRIAIDSF